MLSVFGPLFCTALFLPLALATNSHKKTCIDYEIPVTPTSVNLPWGKTFTDNFDVADFISNINSRTAATSFNPYDTTTAPELTTASYSISATFCTPKRAATGTLLLLSHGLNFDRR